MTAQIRETIVYKGKKHLMATEPLNEFLKRKDLRFEPSLSALWRGYIGKWKIKYKKLYLIELTGKIENLPIPYEDSMEYLFPGQKEVFADWFSGEVIIPVGEVLEYFHMGYGSTFEKNIILEIQNGVLMSEREIDNRG